MDAEQEIPPCEWALSLASGSRSTCPIWIAGILNTLNAAMTDDLFTSP